LWDQFPLTIKQEDIAWFVRTSLIEDELDFLEEVDIIMEQELVYRNAQFNGDTNPYNKRANNFTWQFFYRKIEKRKIYFSFR
jgi:hypothetical protein